MVKQIQEDAEDRLLGKRRFAKRKGKRSNFFKRPDRTKGKNRKTLSNSKSDKIDSDHTLVEASD